MCIRDRFCADANCGAPNNASESATVHNALYLSHFMLPPCHFVEHRDEDKVATLTNLPNLLPMKNCVPHTSDGENTPSGCPSASAGAARTVPPYRVSFARASDNAGQPLQGQTSAKRSVFAPVDSLRSGDNVLDCLTRRFGERTDVEMCIRDRHRKRAI